MAYAANDDTKGYIVVDGVRDKEYKYVGQPVFGPAGKRLAYKARKGEGQIVVLDGVEGSPQDVIRHIVFSPDGRRMAYVADRSGQEYLVVDGTKETNNYDAIVAESLTFSRDGRRVGCVARIDGQYAAVVDGIASKRYEEITHLAFSPDGKRVTYQALKEGGWVVVVDSAESGIYCSFRGNRGINPIVEGTPVFAPNGKRVAYAVRKYISFGKSGHAVVSTLVVNGREVRTHDTIQDLVFSPDGKHITYIARRFGSPIESTKWVVIVDGAESREYDGFVAGSRLVFDSADSLHALACRDAEIFLIQIDVHEK